jgi:hypothetical protein
MSHNHVVTALVIVQLEETAEFLRGQISGAIEDRGDDQRISEHIRAVEAAAELLAAYSTYAQGIDAAMKPLKECVECGGELQWRCPACRIAQSAAVAQAPTEGAKP